ncbi:MAG: WD40/YVTN/BNR-like repeat-containing protein [Chthoniobacterales bacterium]
MKTFTALIVTWLCAEMAQAQVPSPSLAGARPGAAEASPSASPETPPAGALSPAPSATPPQLTEVLFKSFKARSIGPAAMGGRVSDIAIDPRNPAVFFVGLATGGLLKTSDNGVTFDAVFDKQPVMSIGAVAIAPSDTDVVWVGTGEPTDRNSAEWGNGLYRSTDGGTTWQRVGLENSRSIGRVLVHPKSAETAYVAALGNLWADGGERGLFKTTDAGKTWKAVLIAPAPHNARTGCVDVAIAPDNPEAIYAAMYARQRTPWSFTYGASATNGEDVGGIFKSTNGGGTWKKCGNGLPGMTGKIGLAVTPVNPKIVMAVVQSDEGGTSAFDDIHSKRGGVFRSEDAGETWKRMSDLDPRPFYFSQIRIDPANDQRVYLLGFALLVSDDGGKTFREDLSEKLHPDMHALAIQNGSAPAPKPPKPEDKNKPPKPPVSLRVIVGNDGGVYQSYAGGKNWEHLNRFAAGEYYRISVDDSKPAYRIAGGLQDNSNWVGPSAVLSKEGIRNSDWTPFTGADGFYVLFDPTDRDVLYGDNQEGVVHRFNMRTGELRNLKPQPPEGRQATRFHWNSPLVMSRHKPGVLYLGGNFVYRLTDRAERYQVISPDLTRNDPGKTNTVGSGAESYGVVYSLAESPVRAGTLWAGTDDGRLWLSNDDGAHWNELTENLPEPIRNQWIVRIEPGAQDANVAYVAANAYRSGDDRPMIARTGDGGKTWTSVTGDLPVNAPVEVIREDLANPKLLYAGTHFGLFASFDQGGHWVRIGDMPPVRVDDIEIHPRTFDLAIATHGRSLYVLDDARAFRELTPEIAAKPAHLFSVRPVNGFYMPVGFSEWNGKGVYRGANPPEGALFTAWVREFTGDEIKIAISNAAGMPVANLKAPGVAGFTRINWDLRPTEDVLTKYGGDDPKKLLSSGDYTAELSFGQTKVKQTFHVDLAEGILPRGGITQSD